MSGRYVLTRDNLEAYYRVNRPDALNKIDNILSKIDSGEHTAEGIAGKFKEKYGVGPKLVWVPDQDDIPLDSPQERRQSSPTKWRAPSMPSVSMPSMPSVSMPAFRRPNATVTSTTA